MHVMSACHQVEYSNHQSLSFCFINPQMSFVADNNHPKQDESPVNDGFKNGDINIDFTQLKLDDKGKDENVLFV